MKLSIIIPTFNEINTIEGILRYVQSVSYPIPHEIVIVDDASVDRTYEKQILLRLKNRQSENNIRLFKNRVNRGKGFSLRKGIRRARGTVIIVQDADKEYNPHDIPKLLEPILKGETDAVYGSRFLHSDWPRGMAAPNWIANKLLTWLTNILYGSHLTDTQTCYKVFRADILKKLKLRANRFDLDTEVTALALKHGIKIKELPISYHARTAKQGKKVRPRDLFYAVLMLIRCLFV